MIGIIGAMNIEVNILVEKMTDIHDYEIAGSTYHIGKINGVDAAVVVCGIGKVCAAMSAQILIDRFNVSSIINTGIAGGLDDRLRVGDIVIATDAVQHDFDITVFGYAKGGFPCYNGPKETTSHFNADKQLSDSIEKAANCLIESCKVLRGTVASGDKFISDDSDRTSLKTDFGAFAAEMEGGAIAQVCYLNKIPFAIIRAISDLAGDNAGISYDEFEKFAAERSAQILLKAIQGDSVC